MKYLYRAFEEAFPFFPFLVSRNKIQKLIGDNADLTKKSKRYEQIGASLLNVRIKEEHERGIKIDEKTFKFTLGLSISLTVLAAASGSLAKYLPSSPLAEFTSIICGVSALYMLAAGITALGALKTLPTYGYGTEHIINQNADGVSYLSQALFAQERMNIIRHLRNESSYQSLRNGFLLLFFALAISVGAYVGGQDSSKSESKSVEGVLKVQKKSVDRDKLTVTSEKANNAEKKTDTTVEPIKE
ncbi:hypothetical protein [Alteromonas sp. a30]|uniref:hypothetical protein n=1 Tax=Alteromonas sp. a30 TaxID=2730917 RepID=UPI00227FD1CB|nr:hypothetical protein [Alteromonas sp. a30]MCY7296343.1 hypothetical protein [Alteromonas sp. a30]